MMLGVATNSILKKVMVCPEGPRALTLFASCVAALISC